MYIRRLESRKGSQSKDRSQNATLARLVKVQAIPDLSNIRKHSEMKLRSMNRSFSRRRHHMADNSMHGDSTVESSSVNKKMCKQKLAGSSRNNISDIKGKAASYFGFKKTKKSESPEPVRRLETGDKDRAVLEIKELYTNKEYHRCVQEVGALLRTQPRYLKNTSLLFYLAMSHFKLEQHKEARKYFETILELDEAYKKSVYLFLAISLKKEEQFDQAILVLTKCALLYPNFSEAKVHSPYLDIHVEDLHQEEDVHRSNWTVRRSPDTRIQKQSPGVHGSRGLLPPPREARNCPGELPARGRFPRRARKRNKAQEALLPDRTAAPGPILGTGQRCTVP
jgi:tetratricopeptide (TPR) repeat protein